MLPYFVSVFEDLRLGSEVTTGLRLVTTGTRSRLTFWPWTKNKKKHKKTKKEVWKSGSLEVEGPRSLGALETLTLGALDPLKGPRFLYSTRTHTSVIVELQYDCSGILFHPLLQNCADLHKLRNVPQHKWRDVHRTYLERAICWYTNKIHYV